MFWLLIASYTSIMTRATVKRVLTLFPEMHPRHSLLMNREIVPRDMAVDIAQRIRVVAWFKWRINPPVTSANSGLISLLYSLLEPKPRQSRKPNSVAQGFEDS
jgi:hypothetical protein